MNVNEISASQSVEDVQTVEVTPERKVPQFSLSYLCRRAHEEFTATPPQKRLKPSRYQLLFATNR